MNTESSEDRGDNGEEVDEEELLQEEEERLMEQEAQELEEEDAQELEEEEEAEALQEEEEALLEEEEQKLQEEEQEQVEDTAEPDSSTEEKEDGEKDQETSTDETDTESKEEEKEQAEESTVEEPEEKEEQPEEEDRESPDERTEEDEEDETKKILVVDDEQQIRKIVQHVLEKEGFEVEGVENTVTAEQLLTHTSFDLILLDIMLPGRDGVTFLEDLREKEKYDDLPIIMMSARREKETIVKSIAAGTDDYIVKPFETGTLLEKIDEAIQQNVEHS